MAEATTTEGEGNTAQTEMILACLEDFEKSPFLGSDEFCTFKSCASDSLKEMRKNGILCDVTLLVGPEKVRMKAHRVILAATSDYFKTMFTSGFQESRNSEIELKGIRPGHMEVMLDLWYSKGNVLIDQTMVHIVAFLADFFQSKSLIQDCSSFFEKCVSNVECNLFEVYRFAEQFGFEGLKKKAKTRITCTDFEKVCDSKDKNDTHEMEFCFEREELFEHSTTKYSQVVLFDGVPLYVAASIENESYPKDFGTVELSVDVVVHTDPGYCGDEKRDYSIVVDFQTAECKGGRSRRFKAVNWCKFDTEFYVGDEEQFFGCGKVELTADLKLSSKD